MANRNSAGFGFRPNGTLGNTPATQGLSQYWIDSAASQGYLKRSRVLELNTLKRKLKVRTKL